MLKKLIFPLFLILVFLSQSSRILSANEDLSKQAEIIQSLIYKGNFKDAEPIVRKCLEKVPNDLYFLSQLDMVLNGLGKFEEADKIRDNILDIWDKYYKERWIKKGSPVGENSWARVFSFSKDYYVIGCEYYTPEVIGKDPAKITNYFKILGRPKSGKGKTRLFKLEMSELMGKYYVLSEISDKGFQQIIPYGAKKPDLRLVVKDLIRYLNSEQGQVTSDNND